MTAHRHVMRANQMWEVAGGVLLGSGLALLMFSAVYLFGPEIEQKVRGPVLWDWQVRSWRAEGKDVVLVGTMRKRWSCDFRYPHQAIDEDGKPYVVDSASQTRSVNWPADNLQRIFGPWTVREGAERERLCFFSEHRCHSWWPHTTVLGCIDTRSNQ